MSANELSERDAISVRVNSQRGELIGITATFENVSERKITLHVININDETRKIISEEVGQLSVPGTHFDQ